VQRFKRKTFARATCPRDSGALASRQQKTKDQSGAAVQLNVINVLSSSKFYRILKIYFSTILPFAAAVFN
jgi:hypothetical protein